ncbi:MAG TPA: LptF/LptG family permease [Planctomycetia bacterium]|nr:LptF/LptG family permease [Planctomycetia bacterium]
MRKIDRYLFRRFLGSFCMVFLCLVGLYIVIDLFANADEFMSDHAGQWTTAQRAVKFYAIHSFEYFWRLAPIITQIAAMTTLADLHRHNEIVALLAAGIPTRRALAPILTGVFLVVALGVANREWVLPANADFLQRPHANVDGTHEIEAKNYTDAADLSIRPRTAYLDPPRLEHVKVTLPDLQVVECRWAHFETDSETGRRGIRLEGVSEPEPRMHERIKALGGGAYFVFTDAQIQDFTRRNNWMIYASTKELLRELAAERVKNPQEIRSLIHNRIMQPFGTLLLVLLGIPFVLQWNRRNIYRSLFISMVLSASFFAVDAVCTYVGGYGYVEATLAGWIPVFLFGPIAASLLHKIGT